MGHTNRLALRHTYPINPFHPLRIDARIAWTRTALKPISIYPFTNACNHPIAAAQIYQNVPFQVKRFQRDGTEVRQGAYAHAFCPTPISKHRLRPCDQPQIFKTIPTFLSRIRSKKTLHAFPLPAISNGITKHVASAREAKDAYIGT